MDWKTEEENSTTDEEQNWWRVTDMLTKKVKGGPENGLENGKRKPDNR